MQTLATDEISKSYRGRRVVNGVSLRISQGEVVGLLGPNGAGKTTSFYMIVGLAPPDTGRVLLDDEDISDVPMYLRARNYGISYLPQEPSVFRKLTVEENILAVLEAQPISWHERRERLERLIDQLGLGVTDHREVHVVVLRLFDEALPFGALDRGQGPCPNRLGAVPETDHHGLRIESV